MLNDKKDKAKHFDIVFEALADLHSSVHSKTYLNLDNFEVLFGSIEMARILHRFVDYDSIKIESLYPAMITLIVETLQRTIAFGAKDEHIVAPLVYSNFAKILSKINEYEYVKLRKFEYEYSFLTFNYDVALDMALAHNGFNPNYCLGGVENEKYCPLLKLHGSLNWSRCPDCNSIQPLAVNKSGLSAHYSTKTVYFNISDKLDRIKCCNKNLSGPPIIVPPTWNKSEHHQMLSIVWQKAAQELSCAENIFIIGYSMPESDYFFKFLMALGANSKTRLSRFWVFNPDESLEERFRKVISRGVERSFRYYPVKFSQVIDILREELK
jgi:hypothetical protein